MNNDEILNIPQPDPEWDYYKIWTKLHKQFKALNELLIFLTQQKESDLITDIHIYDLLRPISEEIGCATSVVFDCPPEEKCPSCESSDITENETFGYYRCHAPYCHTAWLDKKRHPSLCCLGCGNDLFYWRPKSIHLMCQDCRRILGAKYER